MPGKWPTAELNRPRVWADQAQEHPAQGGLARAGLADDPQCPPRCELKVDTAKGVNGVPASAARVVDDVHVPQREERLGKGAMSGHSSSIRGAG